MPSLYSGRVRPWHLLLVLLAGLIALAAAIAVTPVGQEWWRHAAAALTDLLSTCSRTLHVISFRYHIVSLVSVFLALAVGVALGGGPLSDIGRADGAADGGASSRTAALSDRLDTSGAAGYAGPGGRGRCSRRRAARRAAVASW